MWGNVKLFRKLRAAALAALGGTTVLIGAALAEGQDEAVYELPPYLAPPLAFHHHPQFRFVYYDPDIADGPLPRITGMRTPPANLGIDPTDVFFNFREVHTHDSTSGTVHVESPDPTIKYRLGHFLAVWLKADPRIQKLIDQTKKEGTVYLFDYQKANQSYLTTRMKDAADFEALPLDDNRHIVVYLPGKAKKAPTMVPSS